MKTNNADDSPDSETRRAVERAIASLPIRLPHPGLDGAITVNPITGQVIEPINSEVKPRSPK